MLVKIWSNRNSYSLLVVIQNNVATLEDSLEVPLKKKKTVLPYALAIKNVGINPKVLKTYIYTKTCTWMFIVALFIVAKIWKQQRCPSLSEWMKTLPHPDNGILFRAKKK